MGNLHPRRFTRASNQAAKLPAHLQAKGNVASCMSTSFFWISWFRLASGYQNCCAPGVNLAGRMPAEFRRAAESPNLCLSGAFVEASLNGPFRPSTSSYSRQGQKHLVQKNGETRFGGAQREFTFNP